MNNPEMENLKIHTHVSQVISWNARNWPKGYYTLKGIEIRHPNLYNLHVNCLQEMLEVWLNTNYARQVK